MRRNHTSSEITKDYFAAVLKLPPTDVLSDAEAQYWRTLSTIIERSGVTGLRSPGGTEAWLRFDFRNPIHVNQLKSVIDVSAKYDLFLQFTVNLRQFFFDSTTPEDGTLSMSRVDEQDLQRFIRRDLLKYSADQGVRVAEIQLDNEPLHRNDSGHFLNFREYGALAAHYANLIGPTVLSHNEKNGSSTKIVLATASSEGALNQLAHGQNPGQWGIAAILYYLRERGAEKFINAIDIHYGGVTLHPTLADISGSDSDSRHFFGESLVEAISWQINSWRSVATMPGSELNDLSFHISAWSHPKLNDGGSSLANSFLGPLHLHAYSSAGVDSVTNYILMGADANALYSLSGRERPAGTIFGLMSRELVGLTAVSLTEPEAYAIYSNGPQLSIAFAGVSKIVAYVFNNTAGSATVRLDVHGLVRRVDADQAGFIGLSGAVVGVQSGFAPTDPYAEGIIKDLQVNFDAGLPNELAFPLLPYEVAQIVVPLNLIGTRANEEFNIDHRSRVVDGGAGFDTVSFSGVEQRMSFFSASGAIEFRESIVHLRNIERLIGSEHNDRFILATGSVEVFGGRGNDNFAIIGEQAERAYGDDGDDLFFIHSGTGTSVFGGSGDDRFFVNALGSNVFGGSGDDSIVFTRHSSGVFHKEENSGIDTIFGFDAYTTRIAFYGVEAQGIDIVVDQGSTILSLGEDGAVILDNFADFNVQRDAIFL